MNRRCRDRFNTVAKNPLNPKYHFVAEHLAAPEDKMKALVYQGPGLWSQNITITTRLVDTVTTPMLLKTVQSGKIDPRQLITHHFTLDRWTPMTPLGRQHASA
jgi:threonine dehydrogenase-like Zn-dependent dehydrogenase